MESSFYIFNKKAENEFHFLHTEIDLTNIETILNSLSENDIYLILSKIINCLIMKSQILTEKRQKIINSIEINTSTKYSIDDFVDIKYLNNNVQLYYNIKDQLLYVLKSFDTDNAESSKYYQREIDFYKKMNNQNPFICKFFGTFQSRNKNIIVIEYVEGQTLEEFILKSNNQISLLEKVKIILNIILTVEYIHLNDLIMRDLKWDNIIIDSNNNAIFIDFDRVKEPSNDCDEPNTINFGCEIFMSPEQYLNSEYSFKSDVYTIGMIIHFILNEIPYNEIISTQFLNNLYKSKQNILSVDSLANIPKENEYLLSLYKSCFEFSPELRPNITELFYKIFNGIKSKYKNDELQEINELFNIRKEQLKCLFGIDHHNQKEISYDINKLTKFLTIASNMNDPEAALFLGTLHYNGKYLPMESKKYLEYFTQAADQDCSIAQTILGKIYYFGEKGIPADINKAIHYFTLASKKDPEANRMLGYVYLEEKYFPKDISKTIYYWKLASDQNDVDSQILLALLYLDGKYIPIEIDNGIYYLKLSADQKNPYAQFLLGTQYYINAKTQEDFEKSFHYLNLSANQNFIEANYFLGVIYYENIKFHDIKKALSNFKIAANHNHLNALYYLGKILFRGEYVQQNIDMSIYYLKLASSLNHTESQLLLGIIYYKVLLDIIQAIKYLTLASNQNNKKAQQLLGIIYYMERYNVQDINKAFYYFTLTSDQISSQYYLGEIYYSGQFCPRDINKAIYYWTLASNSGDDSAQYDLGRMYCDGKYTPLDIEKGLNLIISSANQNNKYALNYLGLFYSKQGSPYYNIEKAVYYFTIASNIGSPEAQQNLGMLYYVGEEISQDIDKGIQLLQSSSDKNNKLASYFLAIIYIEDKYIPMDVDKSINYFNLSIKQGFIDAMYNLGALYLEKKYNKQDIKKAIQLFTISADKIVESRLILGKIYYEGIYVPRDIDKAMRFFNKCDNYKAKNNIGVIYKNGVGVLKNINLAIDYFEDAIKSGDYYSAPFNLARIYYFADGVDQNIAKSIELLDMVKCEYKNLAILFIILICLTNETMIHKVNYYINVYKFYLYNQSMHFLNCLSTFHNDHSLDEWLRTFEFYDITYPFLSNDIEYFQSLYKDQIVKNSNANKNELQKDINHLFYEGFGL